MDRSEDVMIDVKELMTQSATCEASPNMISDWWSSFKALTASTLSYSFPAPGHQQPNERDATVSSSFAEKQISALIRASAVLHEVSADGPQLARHSGTPDLSNRH